MSATNTHNIGRQRENGFHFDKSNIKNNVLLPRKKISIHRPIHVPCASDWSGALYG
jgi:hypothetical protein